MSTGQPGRVEVYERASLVANRDGRLTRRQAALTRHDALIGALGASAFTVLGAGVLFSSGPRSGTPTPVSLGQWAAVAVVAAGVGLGWFWYATRGTRAGRVSSVEGTIHKEEPYLLYMQIKGAIYLFSMTIGTHRFTHVPAAMYDAAPDSGRVRVYFRVGDRKPVNFEVLAPRDIRER